MTAPITLNPATTSFPSGLPGNTLGGGLVRLGSMLLSGIDAYGVQWDCISPLQGWDSSPASSRQSTQKTRGPGGWSGPRNLATRSIVIEGYVTAPDPNGLQDAIERLHAAVTLNDTILTIVRGDRVRSAVVARQDEVMVSDITHVTASWSVQLGADDPRKFAPAIVATTGLPSVSGGFVGPFTGPFTSTATVSSGLLTVTNPGNATGPLWMRIDGPITGPQVTHIGSGTQLILSTALTLGVGEWVEIDMEAQTVLAQGQASRNGYIVSRGWFGFETAANQFAFTATSGTGQLTVRATPAWL